MITLWARSNRQWRARVVQGTWTPVDVHDQWKTCRADKQSSAENFIRIKHGNGFGLRRRFTVRTYGSFYASTDGKIPKWILKISGTLKMSDCEPSCGNTAIEIKELLCHCSRTTPRAPDWAVSLFVFYLFAFLVICWRVEHGAKWSLWDMSRNSELHCSTNCKINIPTDFRPAGVESTQTDHDSFGRRWLSAFLSDKSRGLKSLCLRSLRRSRKSVLKNNTRILSS